MKAIILAAGTGSRLMPLTAEKPKCMVKLAGRPLLHRQIETLRGAGVDVIVLVGGYRSDQLEGDFDFLELNHSYHTTNMVQTLFTALEHMKEGQDLIITYGDIVFEPRVINAVINCDAPIVTAIDQEWRKYWQTPQVVY